MIWHSLFHIFFHLRCVLGRFPVIKTARAPMDIWEFCLLSLAAVFKIGFHCFRQTKEELSNKIIKLTAEERNTSIDKSKELEICKELCESLDALNMQLIREMYDTSLHSLQHVSFCYKIHLHYVSLIL